MFDAEQKVVEIDALRKVRLQVMPEGHVPPSKAARAP